MEYIYILYRIRSIGSSSVLEKVGMSRLEPEGTMLRWKIQMFKERLAEESEGTMLRWKIQMFKERLAEESEDTMA